MILLDESFIPCTIMHFIACSMVLADLKPGRPAIIIWTIDKNARNTLSKSFTEKDLYYR